ncbi:MAG: M20/M25/M40 family metallo-hydrolase [Clostridia bacterium]|nr:M20/M25/M40 family metallo-hydrolase [Clostridia bacterium]
MNITAFVSSHYEELITLIKTLAVIPAPSHHEERRATFCRDWMRKYIADNALIDEANNAVCELGDPDAPAVLLMAHTDIVFDETVELAVTEREGRLYCPGIGDDTAHVAILLMCGQYLASQPLPKGVRFILAANTCEEGEGNLKGCRALMARYGPQLSEVITLDGYLDTLNDRAVGSKRYRIAVDTAGGHSFRDFGRDNAIAVAAELIGVLSAAPLPSEHITTFNFGCIEGGTTVNSIASHCEFTYEFRADHSDNLRYMTARFEDTLRPFAERVRLTVTDLGVRPCADGVDPARQERLIARTEAAFEGITHLRRYPASTDANLPLSMGIPAVCIGCVRGGGAHTEEEYIESASLKDGLTAALRLAASYLKDSDIRPNGRVIWPLRDRDIHADA